MIDIENNRKRLTKRKDRNKKDKKKKFLYLALLFCIILCIIIAVKFNNKNEKVVLSSDASEEINEQSVQANEEEIKRGEILISIAGDCTLGTDTKFSYSGSMQSELDKYNNDYSKLLRNVFEVFSKDDYTIVNLETTFSNSEVKRNKGDAIAYNFKGPKEYVNILTSSSVEGVTISNNHIYDYGTEGFNDTIQTLNKSKVDYCGEGYKILKEIKGVKVGFLGYNGWYDSQDLRDKIFNDIKELREKGANIIIPYFHWGEENNYKPNSTQTQIARYAIDSGAHMVIGSHPHVLQSMEEYKGKLIAYSMGNFCFGGNSNPSDKRSLILQAKFIVEKDSILEVQYNLIPVMISSVEYRNDYTPTIAIEGREQEIYNMMMDLSPTIKVNINSGFFKMQ